ncbi:YitT family protein [Donghicola sp. C2-DW-16]|uniref:YitT family protein n=1 Tax=Donghicola mangrovi TaxID=2729614 RepID=A0A850Q6G6_9RHOB|nr:YitT family protein [Donghicola mangrovi]NVO23752.1 YitT family protein [Donghicola mangrovi]NVO26774.1 YitT family protein [Donghicola mangrovi]
MAEPHNSINHTIADDAQAFALGTTMCSLGLLILTNLGLITGQTAGLAVLLSYITGIKFGILFFLVNIPFYVLAYLRMGPRFTIKTFIAVALLSFIADALPNYVQFSQIDPVVGTIIMAGVTGLGLMVLFRHGASLGGIGVLALYLQDKTGFRAGHTQLIFDACLFTVAFFILPLPTVLYSLLGAVIVNLIIATNHRRDRYIAL